MFWGKRDNRVFQVPLLDSRDFAELQRSHDKEPIPVHSRSTKPSIGVSIKTSNRTVDGI